MSGFISPPKNHSIYSSQSVPRASLNKRKTISDSFFNDITTLTTHSAPSLTSMTRTPSIVPASDLICAIVNEELGRPSILRRSMTSSKKFTFSKNLIDKHNIQPSSYFSSTQGSSSPEFSTNIKEYKNQTRSSKKFSTTAEQAHVTSLPLQELISLTPISPKLGDGSGNDLPIRLRSSTPESFTPLFIDNDLNNTPKSTTNNSSKLLINSTSENKAAPRANLLPATQSTAVNGVKTHSEVSPLDRHFDSQILLTNTPKKNASKPILSDANSEEHLSCRCTSSIRMAEPSLPSNAWKLLSDELKSTKSELQACKVKCESLAKHLVKLVRERISVERKAEKYAEILEIAQSELRRYDQQYKITDECSGGNNAPEKKLDSNSNTMTPVSSRIFIFDRFSVLSQYYLLKAQYEEQISERKQLFSQFQYCQKNLHHAETILAKERACRLEAEERLVAIQQALELEEKRSIRLTHALDAYEVGSFGSSTISSIVDTSLPNVLSPCLPHLKVKQNTVEREENLIDVSPQQRSTWPLDARRAYGYLRTQLDHVVLHATNSADHATLQLRRLTSQIEDLEQQCNHLREELHTTHEVNGIEMKRKIISDWKFNILGDLFRDISMDANYVDSNLDAPSKPHLSLRDYAAKKDDWILIGLVKQCTDFYYLVMHFFHALRTALQSYEELFSNPDSNAGLDVNHVEKSKNKSFSDPMESFAATNLDGDNAYENSTYIKDEKNSVESTINNKMNMHSANNLHKLRYEDLSHSFMLKYPSKITKDINILDNNISSSSENSPQSSLVFRDINTHDGDNFRFALNNQKYHTGSSRRNITNATMLTSPISSENTRKHGFKRALISPGD